MANSILDFFFNLFSVMSKVFTWLNTPLFNSWADLPLGWQVLSKLGVNIDWLYGTTPMFWLSTGLVTTLTALLIIKIVGLILNAIPVL